ncbi:MAG: hypothetical protein ACRDHU_04925, partial [Actinomycetota bacterium]
MSDAPSGGAVGPRRPSQGDGSLARHHRRFELPEDLAPEEERAIIRALERYFARESPHPAPWVLAGRVDATGLGALQARRYTNAPWGAVLF